jgi:hypothetical protein
MAIDLSSFKGTYRANVGARTTVEMLPLLILQATLHFKGKNATISAVGRSPITLTSLGDSLWLGTDGGTYFFRKLSNGTMQFFRTNADWNDPMTFTRIRWFENGLLHLGIIISGFLLYLFTSLLFGLRLIYFKWKNKHQLPVLKKLGMLVILASVLILASAVVAILYLRSGKGAPGLANYSTLYFIFGFFSCGVLTSLAVPFYTCANLRNKTFPTGWKIYFTVFSIEILLLIPVLWYWNLLGFNF